MTAADRIYQEMREEIITGELAPGARLVHRRLAERFGSSNIPVVEALRRLESDGLIVSYPNAGAQVRVWDEHDIRSAFLAREALEGVTCRLFAEQATPIARRKLAEYSRRFDEAAASGALPEGRRTDIQLHLHIARSASSHHHDNPGSSSLFRLFETSCLLSATINNACLPPGRQFSGPVGAHDDLLAALDSGDPDVAEAAGRFHVRNTMEECLACWAERDA